MKIISSTELRDNLAKYLDEVEDNRTPIIVTRENRGNVILISEEDYNAMLDIPRKVLSKRFRTG